MDKVKTGIVGLDEMLEGGFPENHQIFLCGGPGTGKTTLALEYLYHGAKQGEKGLFFTLEEDPNAILQNAGTVFKEWDDLKELIDSKKIVISGQDDYPHLLNRKRTGEGTQYAFSGLVAALKDQITNNGIKRVVIDSSTMIRLFFETDLEFRRTLYNLVTGIKKLGCTSLITAELPSLERAALTFDAEHFVADGLVMLYNLEQQEKRLFAIEVLKMRGTAHSKALTPFKITPAGVYVYVGEKVY